MTVQLSDGQLQQLEEARSSLATVISRNRTRWVDIELAAIRSALDAVLPPRSQSEQTRLGGPVPGNHGSPTDDRI